MKTTPIYLDEKSISAKNMHASIVSQNRTELEEYQTESLSLYHACTSSPEAPEFYWRGAPLNSDDQPVAKPRDFFDEGKVSDSQLSLFVHHST